MTTYFSRGKITLIGYCYDSLGARSSATAIVEVSEQNDLILVQTATEALPS